MSMKLPFFYPGHPEFKAHVDYVATELYRFSNADAEEEMSNDAIEAWAKKIVLHVGSRKVSWWELLIDRITGRTYQAVDDQFEKALDNYLLERIKAAKPQPVDGTSDSQCYSGQKIEEYEANLLSALGLADEGKP